MKILCSGGDNLGVTAMEFGVNTLGSLKVGFFCDFSAEEVLEKMEPS